MLWVFVKVILSATPDEEQISLLGLSPEEVKKYTKKVVLGRYVRMVTAPHIGEEIHLVRRYGSAITAVVTEVSHDLCIEFDDNDDADDEEVKPLRYNQTGSSTLVVAKIDLYIEHASWDYQKRIFDTSSDEDAWDEPIDWEVHFLKKAGFVEQETDDNYYRYVQ